MLRLLAPVLGFLICSLSSPAQTAGQLQKELRAKETAAKKDPEALFEAAQWAAERSLAKDAKRLFEAVLKINPDHAGANEALGNALVEGKWIPAKEAEALRKKALAAEYSAKGFVEVNGVWVEKEHVDDAKRGVFHHDGDLVTREEKLALLTGKVRHPVTGQLIDAKNEQRARDGYFPAGSEAKWVDLKEAETFHSDMKRPWVLRTHHATVVSTLGLSRIQELAAQMDIAIKRVSDDLFGSKPALPAKRPTVLIAATTSEYRDIGNSLGDGTDACGAFLIREEARLKVPLVGDVRGAACNNEKDWAPFYARHAAALAYANAIAEEAGLDLPLWLLHGFGAYTSRFATDHDAAHFAKLHLEKGGVRGLKSFFSGFAISGDMEGKDIDYNIFQAGLLVKFAQTGSEPKVTEAFQAVVDLLTGKSKGGLDKPMAKLQGALIEAEPKIAAYLQQIAGKR